MRRARTVEVVKAFLIYTALRLMLFTTSLVIIGGLYVLVVSLASGSVAQLGSGEVFVIVALAAVASAYGSWKFLGRQREQLAQIVQARAERAGDALERSRSKEDVD